MLWVVLATGDRCDVALVAGRRDRDRWWWWLRKSSVWLVDDAKLNVGKRQRSFRKVDTKPTYI